MQCNAHCGSRSGLSLVPISNTLSHEKREDLQFRLQRLLEAHPEYSQRAIAQTLGVSLGGAHYCLKAVNGKGLVEAGNFSASRHKWGNLHGLTARGMAERAALTQRFLQRKLAEYALISAEIEALQREASKDGAGAGARNALSAAPGCEPGARPMPGVG